MPPFQVRTAILHRFSTNLAGDAEGNAARQGHRLFKYRPVL
jgi:hypothetical protein